MILGIARETFPGERRVALTPLLAPSLKKAGLQTIMETEAGDSAGFLDVAYKGRVWKLSNREPKYSGEPTFFFLCGR